jgi:nucleoid-associated protein YgaU
MQPVVYVVKRGDTLGGIASYFYGDGTEKCWRRIYDCNKPVIGYDPDHLEPGEILKIPVGTLPCQYTVKYGDTLSGIALCFYGDGTERGWRPLYDANKDVIGDDPDHLVPGEVLTLSA